MFRWINGTCAVLEPADARALREGVGFAMGHGMEPYSAAPAMMLADLVQLGEQGCRDACRGVGWGYRQRWSDPPDEIPDGLGVYAAIPDAAKDAFLDGLFARELPAEAAVLAREAE